jgi:hypothetical protein
VANWNDRSERWESRGTEHAAEIITWGLIEFPITMENWSAICASPRQSGAVTRQRPGTPSALGALARHG